MDDVSLERNVEELTGKILSLLSAAGNNKKEGLAPRTRPSSCLKGYPLSRSLHAEVIPSVLGPACLGLFRTDGLLLSEAHRADPVLRDAQVRQVLRSGVRPALAQGHVVLVGPALVAVALDNHLRAGVLLEPLGIALERIAELGLDDVLVELEVDRLELIRCRTRRNHRRNHHGRFRCRRRRRGRSEEDLLYKGPHARCRLDVLGVHQGPALAGLHDLVEQRLAFALRPSGVILSGPTWTT